MKINLSPLELHKYLEAKIPNFEDAELLNNTSDTKYQLDEEAVDAQIEDGYVSVDDTKGHEAYYTILNLLTWLNKDDDFYPHYN